MDITVIIGILAAFGSLVAGIILEKGSVSSYVQLSAAIIVFGGTIGATMTSFSLKDTIGILKVSKKILFSEKMDFMAEIKKIVALGNKARTEGLLALEKEIETIKNPFLKNGIRLTVDGTDSTKIVEILETEMEQMEERHKKYVLYFQTLGGFSPTLGITGTVIGLVIALGNLENPEEMAKNIAAAFIATLYGIASANLLFLPIANKLKVKSQEEVKMKTLQMKGILAIQSGVNPRIIEEELLAFLPPSERQSKGAPGKDKNKK
jgi:chemotaxis protein MotA